MGGSFSDLSPNNNIIGATDNTPIGNVSDAAKVYITNGLTDSIPIELNREYKDSYHKIRVTTPESIFESDFKFSKRQNYWSESTATGGTVTHDTTKKAIKLSTTTTSGSKAVYKTYRAFHYVEGKAQLIYIYGLWGAIATNNRKRAGYFNDNNGAFFETDGTGMYIVARSNATGSVVDTRVASTSWNIDRLDGSNNDNNPSGYTADPTKMQLFIIDLSNGLIRFGVLINEDVVYIHAIACSNYSATACVNSMDLPLQYEIENTGTTSGNNDLYIMNSSISSEGGTRVEGVIKVVDTGTATVSVSTTTKVVAGIRMNSAACSLGASIKPLGFNIVPASGSTMLYYKVILRPTLTGTETWAAFDDIVEVLTDNPTYTAGSGIVLDSGYFELGSGNGNGNGSGIGGGLNASILNDKWLGSAIDGTADKLILIVRTISSTGSIHFSGKFAEFS